MKKKSTFIWNILKNSCIFALANGPVAQLNRVPHYGCGGSRFESWRGHKKENRKVLFFFEKYPETEMLWLA
jgi:hypothetical protein